MTEISNNALYAFYYIDETTEMEEFEFLRFPAQLKRIGSYAFIGASFPNGVVLPNTVEMISGLAFTMARTGVSKLVIPESVKTVGDGAFSNFLVAEFAQFPASLTKKQFAIDTDNPNFTFQVTGETTQKRYGDIFYETFTHEGTKEVRITGYDTFTTTQTLTIPETIDGMTVTELAPNAFGIQQVNFRKPNVQEVILPATIRKVGDSALRFKKVDVSTLQQVEEIGAYAFASGAVYSSSETFVLPATLHTIGDFAFSYMNVSKVHIDNKKRTMGIGIFSNSNITDVSFEEGITHIPAQMFLENKLQQVTLPTSLREIGAHAFQKNAITSIEIPPNVTTIGKRAFLSNKLTSLELPESVQEIGESAFSSNALTTVSMPKKLKTLGNNAFHYNQLRHIYVPQVENLGAKIYNNNPIEHVTFAEGVTNIGEGMFEESNITEITLPDTVTHIGARAFRSNKISTVVLPSSLQQVGEYAFSNNILTTIHIPKGVTFGSHAFANNELRDVTLEEGLKMIAPSMFIDNEISAVVLPSSLQQVGNAAFKNNELTTIHIPKGTVFGFGVFENNKLREVTLEEGVTTIPHTMFSSNQIERVTLPQTITNIEEGAFVSNALTEVTIPPLVKTIGLAAFSSNQLRKVHMFDNVTTIEEHAFSHNPLEQFTWSKKLETIGPEAFYRTKLKKIELPASLKSIGYRAFFESELEEVHIAAVDEIKRFAFQQNNIHTLTLPKQVTTIHDGAFINNALTKVTIPFKTKPNDISYIFGDNPIKEVVLPAQHSTYNLDYVSNSRLEKITLENVNTKLTYKKDFVHRDGLVFAGLYVDAARTKRYTGPEQKAKTIYVSWGRFSDITGHWAQGAIESFTSLGYINGYPDGTFKPGAPIQRKHVARILHDVFKFEAVNDVADFTDVPKSHAYYAAISAVQKAGIFSGDNGKFQPEAHLTRGQLAKVLVLAAGFEPGGKSTFKDTPASYWGTPYVAALADLAIVKGTDGFFNPNKPITRAQFVSMTSLALEEMKRRAQQNN
ncbi:leucine-rich repeat protein [Caryophanon latum]|uniref:SLH domain-containing protein n=1 Tax=Caryophanon latum TaxID=33977 RepID=A0A1C0YJ79_9BACL|nr:leucine-rich repeat protein [Caryophanon latum]OCS87242.1 hypothetical protein A6K76_02405 [Caryophanon latum]